MPLIRRLPVSSGYSAFGRFMISCGMLLEPCEKPRTQPPLLEKQAQTVARSHVGTGLELPPPGKGLGVFGPQLRPGLFVSCSIERLRFFEALLIGGQPGETVVGVGQVGIELERLLEALLRPPRVMGINAGKG